MNTAIIVAAGSGNRFNSKTPKQFAEILGKPIIIHTLEKFEACEAVSQVVLVLPSGEISAFESLIEKFELTKIKSVVLGGASRAESVLNGLNAADPETDIVAVHDGVRPLVSIDEITATIEKAQETGAACLVAVVTDTIKEVGGGNITRTLDRTKLRRAMTPQAFRYSILREALDQGILADDITDECILVERLGHQIAYVEGSSHNIKITRPEDRTMAEALLREFQ
ncbi:MAG: 2-C-methyl-D-erythritol 4-phosphate cytidylyltransferase [Pyrinomonadaceae bacterium]